MYVFGFVGGYFLVRWLAKEKKGFTFPRRAQELVSYLVVWSYPGRSSGYVLFTISRFYFANPLQIFASGTAGCRFMVPHRSIIDGMVVHQETRLSVLPLADLALWRCR